jgi:radical SAM protein with 4Fe4S-binding SPASM domain
MNRAVGHIETLIEAGKPLHWGTPIPACISSRSGTGCLAGEAFATVDPWGNVRPCNHDPHLLGNLLSCSFEEIWRSEALRRWREWVPSGCVGCSLFATCRGGCRAEAILRRGRDYPLPRKPITIEPPDRAGLTQAPIVVESRR